MIAPMVRSPRIGRIASAKSILIKVLLTASLLFSGSAKAEPLPCDGDACISKEQAQAAYTRGMELLKQNKPNEASDSLCQATKVTTAESDATRSRYNVACGTALLKTPDWETAEVFFQQAERADPGYPLLYSGWGAYLERNNDVPGAISRYTEYLKREKDPKRRALFEPRLAALKARADAAGASEAAAKTPATPQPALAAVDSGDCAKICDKLLQCTAGPWTNKSDCVGACDGARDDRTTRKTYSCAAAAKSCKAVSSCGR